MDLSSFTDFVKNQRDAAYALTGSAAGWWTETFAEPVPDADASEVGVAGGASALAIRLAIGTFRKWRAGRRGASDTQSRARAARDILAARRFEAGVRAISGGVEACEAGVISKAELDAIVDRAWAAHQDRVLEAEATEAS